MVVSPLTFAFPLRSSASEGMEVPIPTKPLGFTIKLLESTCTPFLKLNDFLKFAIIISFRVIYLVVFAQETQLCLSSLLLPQLKEEQVFHNELLCIHYLLL